MAEMLPEGVAEDGVEGLPKWLELLRRHIPQIAPQRQMAGPIHRNPLREQQLPLHPITAFTARAHAHAALGVDHPVPGNLRRQRKPPQRPAHLAGTAIGPDQLGNLSIGRQPTVGHQRHSRVDPLVEAGALHCCILPVPLLPRRFERLKAVLNHRMADLTVLLEFVDKPHNLSAILRSCDAVGVLEAHSVSLPGRTPTFNRTAQGSQKWVPLHRHRHSSEALEQLKDQGFRLFGTHLSADAVDYRSCDFTGPTAFVLGAEKWGLSEAAAGLVDQAVVIPMIGMVQSLNVSVATATLLFETLRQRQAAGLVPSQGEGVPPERYSRQLFEWAYPQVAAWCQREGRPYPALDAEGAISEDLPRTLKFRC